MFYRFRHIPAACTTMMEKTVMQDNDEENVPGTGVVCSMNIDCVTESKHGCQYIVLLYYRGISIMGALIIKLLMTVFKMYAKRVR
jgi:hypothetical protein